MVPRSSDDWSAAEELERRSGSVPGSGGSIELSPSQFQGTQAWGLCTHWHLTWLVLSEFVL